MTDLRRELKLVITIVLTGHGHILFLILFVFQNSPLALSRKKNNIPK